MKCIARMTKNPEGKLLTNCKWFSHIESTANAKSKSFLDDPDELTLCAIDDHSCGCGDQKAKELRSASTVVRWTVFVNWTLFILLLTLIVRAQIVDAVNMRSTVSTSVNSLKEGVCQSIDIRNDVKEFSKLRGCRVIEGWLQILLLDKTTPETFNNLVFPDLVEITGYLMLYRVQGLRSIGHLFPNLTVIRGHQLFVNYALITFEMTHLQEIGLHSLTDITRGSVRLERNYVLCYADSIDWDMIAKSGKGENLISGNKPKNECPVCEKHCPVRPDRLDERLCWNKQHCQKICPQCGDNTCNANGECCHPSCLGGCNGPSDRNCTSCRQVVVNDNQCVSSCPPNTYEFRSRRCIQEFECRMMKRPLEIASSVRDQPFKPFGNQCIIDCPPGYEETEIKSRDEYSCSPCKGSCLKECYGNIVDSIASAQKLRGCTHINGNLEITIHEGQNIVRELEESLSSIEIITGYLKVFRSYPLISLNFLRNLKEIRGDELVMKEYTLFVLDNQNLQELWNWTSHPKFKIGSKNNQPKVSFHFNPKLCLHTIEQLRQKTGIAEFTDIEVSSESNGDKVACNVTELRTVISSISSKGCMIRWEPFRHHDPRSLLGYVVYSIEAPNKNISLYDSRDACGGDGWRVDDVAASGADDDRRLIYNVSGSKSDDKHASYTMALILSGLKPFTQYAYYIKTYTISTEKSGAQSALHYFTTLPGQPSVVRGLSIFSNASDSLVISWSPPFEPNGELVHYKIVGEIENYDPVYLAQRDYCVDAMMPQESKPISVIIEEEKKRAEEEQKLSQMESESKCDCHKKEQLQSEKEAYNSIIFEDALHNQVYIKRKPNRRRRDLKASMMLHSIPKKSELYGFIQQDKDKGIFNQNKKLLQSQLKDVNLDEKLNDLVENGSIVKFTRIVPSAQTSFVMNQLRHFGKYSIKVSACRDKRANHLEEECSPAAMKSLQTLRRPGADNIPKKTFGLEKTISNDSSTIIKLFWQEPLQPNGVIVAYQINYARVDVSNHKVIPACVTGSQFREDKLTYTLPTLPPGNYSVKVQATSFAGYGEFSETLYFDIPRLSSETTLGDIAFYIFLAFLFFIFFSMLIVYIFRKKFMRNVPSMRLIATVNPEYVSTVYIPDEWEIPRKKVQLLRELGNGSFGMVYEGLAKDLLKGKPEIKCAVKTVNENATDRERIEFLNEASVMKGFNTHHVVRLLGVVSQGQPTLVVMELMANGDLKSYLRSHRPDYCENFQRQPPTLKQILRMAIEIADGMAYLAAKKFVHRDLAARNCMVAHDLTVKIGDFGMTRDIYETDYYRKGTKGLLPVRWMAPESLKDGVFTSFSDVWSYGVVLWEMVTLASQPYQGLSNDQVLRYIIDGGVMEGPENCPDSLYNLMRQTWHHKATRRPTFIDIATLLLSEVDVESFERVSFYHSPEGVEARNQNNSQFFHSDKDLELVTLEELKEEENEMEENEDSPLHQDFNNFRMTSFPQTTNSLMGDYLDLHSSKAPLKAGFDDFDSASAGSLNSSKDTLDLPFAEEGLHSIKTSPSCQKNKSTFKGSISQISNRSASSFNTPQNASVSRSSASPQSSKKGQTGLDAILKPDVDFENQSTECSPVNDKKLPVTSIHPVNNAVENETLEILTSSDSELPVVSIVMESDQMQQKLPDKTLSINAKIEQQQQPSTVNNGYVSGATT